MYLPFLYFLTCSDPSPLLPTQDRVSVDNKGRKMMGMNTGGFSTANPMTQIDILEKRAAEVPGPGEYHIPGVGDCTSGQLFSTANPKSHIDWAVFEAKTKPGPGQYGAPKRQYIEKGGSGKFPFVYRPKDPSKAHLAKG